MEERIQALTSSHSSLSVSASLLAASASSISESEREGLIRQFHSVEHELSVYRLTS